MNNSYTVSPILETVSEPLPQGNLKSSLDRAERLNKTKSLLLVVPLLAFITVFFLLPIGAMLLRSIQNPTLSTAMPQTAAALANWEGTALPDEQLFATVGHEILALQEARQLDSVGSDLNRVMGDAKSLMARTARGLTSKVVAPGAFNTTMTGIDKRWGQIGTWMQLKKMAPAYSATNYLAALDLRYDDQGKVVQQPESRRIYVSILIKTLMVALGITALCMILGYPLAYMLATLPAKTSNLLMVMVLLPFWTSLLVRTSAWMVILQSNGVLNSTLNSMGLINQPLELMYNMFGTVIAMTHILLPFMVLPMFSVMKSIDTTYTRAAHSMGASSFRTFVQMEASWCSFWPRGTT
jgi:putative spermidine/putrescine transport system permease protein